MAKDDKQKNETAEKVFTQSEVKAMIDSVQAQNSTTTMGLMQRLQNLERGYRTAGPKKVTDRVACVCVIDNQPVVRWDSEKKGLIKLYLLDGTQKEMNYVEWVQEGSNRIKVEILETVKEEIIKSDGFGTKLKPDTDEILAGVHIEYLVKSLKVTAKVRIIEGELQGKEFEIFTDYLNP